MRVMLAPMGTRGDVQPLLELARELSGRGHRPFFCAPENFGPVIAREGFEFTSLGVDVEGWLRTNAPPRMSAAQTLRKLRQFFRESVPEHFERLRPCVARADVVVGAGMQVLARPLTEAAGKPHAHVVYCPQVLPSSAHPPPLLPFFGLPAAANRALWAASDRLYGWMLADVVGPLRRAMQLSARPPRGDWRGAMTADLLLLAADGALGAAPDDVALPVLSTESWSAVTQAPLAPEVEAFLAAGAPPLFIGFGSMPDADPAATAALVRQALEATGARALISAGWAKLQLADLGGQVLGVGDAAHAALFPKVAAVVHHGGAGTTSTAARAGVPQLAVPHIFDQFYWGRRLHALGAAPPPIPRRRLTAARLAEAIGSLLETPSLRTQAKALAERLRGPRGAAQAAERLEALVARSA